MNSRDVEKDIWDTSNIKYRYILKTILCFAISKDSYYFALKRRKDNMINETIRQQIMGLKSIEKIHLVELILESLDKPDMKVQKEWTEESEKRFDAFKAGKLRSHSYEEVMKMIVK